jgi:hypothetical protein
VDIQDVAHELYGLPCEEFAEVRAARAAELSEGGAPDLAREVTALPEPTAAAWALNMLARHRPDRVQKMLALGADVRRARARQQEGRRRRLERRQRQLAAKVTRDVRSLADELGHPIDQPVADEVEQTMCAAMADRDAACALSSGLLVDTLTPGEPGEPGEPGKSGETDEPGHLDVGRAVAVPDAVSLPGTEHEEPEPYDDEPGRVRDLAQGGLEEAQRELDEAEATALAARREVERVRERRARMEAEESELSRRLHHLRRDIARTDRAQKIAERAWRKAGRREAAAHRSLQRSSARLRRMR